METFVTHQFHDTDELKQHLTKIWHGWKSAKGNRMDKWHKCLWAYFHATGGHFEHL